tara:strand:+ start:320 stop:490 length:171 start_codon:yes stop_codon:yes gene_type:complete
MAKFKSKEDITEVIGEDGFRKIVYLDKGQREAMKKGGLRVRVLKGEELRIAKIRYF